jgi:hypothetical protein
VDPSPPGRPVAALELTPAAATANPERVSAVPPPDAVAVAELSPPGLPVITLELLPAAATANPERASAAVLRPPAKLRSEAPPAALTLLSALATVAPGAGVAA